MTDKHLLEAYYKAYSHKHSKLKKLFSKTALKILRRKIASRRKSGLQINAELFTGQQMSVYLPEIVSGSIYTYGFFDECVTTMMLECVNQGDTVLDVGAHFGFFSLLASKLCGDDGRVICFEPTPSTYRNLVLNTSDFSNIVAHNIAIGRNEGTAEINDFGIEYCAWNYMGSSEKETQSEKNVASTHEVLVQNLDHIVQEHKLAPTLIKIDTENYEEEVLLGALQTIETYKPAIILETMSDYAERAGKTLIGMGYTPFISNGKKVQTSNMSWNDLNWKYSNILFKF